ncbi:MAG TPA: GNAT family N-acetyltransferase [Stellaceae bacterium]|nr:GNAT family N-acetyltransferase [Stellaceae bacterium]
MLRPAVPADLRCLAAIRDASGADALSDPALVADAELRRLVGAGAVAVWEEDGEIAGFGAADSAAIHLLVAAGARGKGVGRILLADCCARLKQAGYATATLSLGAGGTAARHYRAAGWTEAGRSPAGGVVLQKPL